MAIMPVEKLQPLMILSEELRDKTGRLLAVKGTAITEKHFLVFKTWGIKEVSIVDEQSKKPDQDFTSEEIMGQVASTIEEIKPLFCHNNLEHPFIVELLRLVAQKKVMNNDI
ncbi:hypothetical protein [uncultured Desulfuromusa sp.]|uniref:hypothetical protein n=1 Tax=uncultured Desulfuromusa sp. TaxID=219183 RepID=UPI002AA5E803|nr:hypothetical protein [uncultured Desulfuromusa sp.]